MEVSRPFLFRTLWMWKSDTVTAHHVITVYNDMFDSMDGMMRALANKKIQWKEDLYFALKIVWQKLSKYHTDITPMTSMLPISAYILDIFRKLRSFRKWDMEMYINSEDETSYTTQSQETFPQYVESEYCTKNRRLLVDKSKCIPNHNFVSFAMASISGQSSYDPYDLSSDDEEYIMPNNLVKMTPGQSDHAARILTATRLYSNSLPEWS